MERSQPNPLMTALAIVAVVIVPAADSIIDIGGGLHYDDLTTLDGTSLALGLVLAAATTVVQIGFSALANRRRVTIQPATAEPEIDPSILERWYQICESNGLDIDDPRTNIQSFPDVLALIQDLEMARTASDDRAMRKQLGNEVLSIMRLTLVPLAAELSYADQQTAAMQELMAEPPAEALRGNAAAELQATRPH